MSALLRCPTTPQPIPVSNASERANVIEVGDFIRSRLNPFVCGFVVSVGHAGRQRGRPVCPGYWFVTANGKKDFADEASIELIAKSDTWWDEVTPELAARWTAEMAEGSRPCF